jgi:hypothetical protein
MPRPGRKRKIGSREPNGRLARIKTAERDKGMIEMITVLRQPHRMGDLDQYRESPLGRFILCNKLRRELYDAGVEYGCLVRHFHAAKGVQRIIVEGTGSGRGVSPEKTKWLTREVRRLERPMRKLSMPGFLAVRRLAVYETEISSTYAAPATVVLYFLALMLKKLGRRR